MPFQIATTGSIGHRADQNGSVRRNASKQRHVEKTLANEVIQNVGGRSHDRGGAGIAKVPFHRQVPAEGGAAWSLCMARSQNVKKAVSAAAALLSSTASKVSGPGCSMPGRKRRAPGTLAGRPPRYASAPTGAQGGESGQRLSQVIEAGGQQVLPGRFRGGTGDPHGDGGGAELEPRQHRLEDRGEAGSFAAEPVRCRHRHALEPHRAPALPRRPSPFHAAETRRPGASAGTKYRVLARGSAGIRVRVETM